MPEKVLCYECGRVKCETCGGYGSKMHDEDYGPVPIPVLCSDCSGWGWRAAAGTTRRKKNGRYLADKDVPEMLTVLGLDPSVLCLDCEKVAHA